MADINTPQVRKFVNERSRPTADRVCSAIRTLREFVAEYAADGIGPLVAGTTDLQNSTVDDGAAQDGRTVLLGFDVDNMKGQAVTLLAFLDANAGIEASFVKVSVNTSPVF